MRPPIPWMTQHASPSLDEAIAYGGHPRADPPGTGGQLRSGLDDRLKYYGPDEMWAFDLAIDLVAALAGLEDISSGGRLSRRAVGAGP